MSQQGVTFTHCASGAKAFNADFLSPKHCFTSLVNTVNVGANTDTSQIRVIENYERKLLSLAGVRDNAKRHTIPSVFRSIVM